jgi:hypothetical protein
MRCRDENSRLGRQLHNRPTEEERNAGSPFGRWCFIALLVLILSG